MKQGRTLKEKGLNKEDLFIYKKIGKEVNTKFIIATGSRVKGYYTDKSDYDCVIVLPIEQRKEVFGKLRLFERENNIKIDAIVSTKFYPTDGVMLEI